MHATYVQQSHAARVILGVGLAVFVTGELSQQLRRRADATRARRHTEVLFRTVFACGLGCLPLGRVLAPDAVIGGGAAVFALASVIGVLGLLLRWWSFLTLGRYFTLVIATSTDQPVIDRGPYRALRHPSYTGLLLAVFGCALMLGNWASLVGSVLLVTSALAYRIRVEEHAMLGALGATYADFAASRARLVPFVW